jgi:hypothetical protein
MLARRLHHHPAWSTAALAAELAAARDRLGQQHRAGDVYAVQQYGEPGNLVRPGADLYLAQDRAVSMAGGSQQVTHRLLRRWPSL